MKVYIAAPFFNPAQLAIVEAVELTLDHRGIEYFSPRSAGVLKDMSKDEQHQTKSDIFNGNIEAMDDCTHMIACVTHRDTGTSFEIGYYFAKDKPVVLYTYDLENINVMLAEAGAVCDKLTRLHDSLAGNYSVEVGEVT